MPRFTIDLSPEIDDRLTKLASKKGLSKADVMRKAFGLIALADTEKDKGNSLGIVREDRRSHELKALGQVVDI